MIKSGAAVGRHNDQIDFLTFCHLDDVFCRPAELNNLSNFYKIDTVSEMIAQELVEQTPVIFDHVTDDCMACSPPQPVRMTWDPKGEFLEGQKGNYVNAGTIPRPDQHLYKLTKYPNLNR